MEKIRIRFGENVLFTPNVTLLHFILLYWSYFVYTLFCQRLCFGLSRYQLMLEVLLSSREKSPRSRTISVKDRCRFLNNSNDFKVSFISDEEFK